MISKKEKGIADHLEQELIRMKNLLRRLTLLLICITGLNIMGYGQSIYNVKDSEGFDIKLKGTSSLHDWEMDAPSTTGKAQFIFNPNGELVSIKSLSFTLQVTDLKSDKSGLDQKAYEALKSDKYKEIRYQLTSSTISPAKESYLIKSKGNLTVSGVTKEIHMDVRCVRNEDGTVTSKGSYQLNMTDYQVEPPSFMWGAMKTGDAITLDFIVVYEKEKGASALIK